MARKTKAQARETRQRIVDAARMVFHQWGVTRSSLDCVAHAANLTRGAIYWHFKDKFDLFLAVREDALLPAFEEIDLIIRSNRHDDPLDGIEASLGRFIRILDTCPDVKMVLETVINRCEHVAEFADVQSDLNVPALQFLATLERAYYRAAALGTLRPGLDPQLLASDTFAFVVGLVRRILADGDDQQFRHRVGELISLHLALRRLGPGDAVNYPMAIDSAETETEMDEAAPSRTLSG